MGSLALAGHAVAQVRGARHGSRRACCSRRRGGRPASQRLLLPLPRDRGPAPFVGLERTRARFEYGEPVAASSTASYLRVYVQLAALEDGDVEPLVTKARRVAREACAPPLGWIADWAEALRAGSLADVVAATDGAQRLRGALHGGAAAGRRAASDPRSGRRRGDRGAAARDGRLRERRGDQAGSPVGCARAPRRRFSEVTKSGPVGISSPRAGRRL